MIIKSKIIEETPTVEHVVYKKGSLDIIKHHLQPIIDEGNCVVYSEESTNVVGKVKSFVIKNRQAELDIDFTNTRAGIEYREKLLHLLGAFDVKVVFPLTTKKIDECNIYGFEYVEIEEIKDYVLISIFAPFLDLE